LIQSDLRGACRKIDALALPYSPSYYKELGQQSRRTARVVVPMVTELLHPASVVDIGCGTGAWLGEFRQAGIDDVMGLDGDWIPRDQLEIPPNQFQATDLSRPFALARTFDVAVCLEVAEHLPALSARNFIQGLVALAPAILFSAAVPFQGGTNHVNEQWSDYWAALFREHDYVAFDCFRFRLWDHPAVQPYVAQNLWLYVAATALVRNKRLQLEHDKVSPFPARAIHPGVFEVPSLRRLVRLLRRTQRAQNSE
jgi:SAM-dependent methyltransferase